VRLALVLAVVPALGACGGGAPRSAACAPAPVHTGPAPKWTADVWSSSNVDLPEPGCRRRSLAGGPHRARIDLAVAKPADPPDPLTGAPLPRTGLRLPRRDGGSDGFIPW
jgi:hypothetical protein